MPDQPNREYNQVTHDLLLVDAEIQSIQPTRYVVRHGREDVDFSAPQKVALAKLSRRRDALVAAQNALLNSRV